MAKRKFLERRRTARRHEVSTAIDSRRKIGEIVDLVSNLGLETRVHRGGQDSYQGFEIWYDTADSFNWIEILNPGLGEDLEIAIYGGFQIVTKESFQNYEETISGYARFLRELEGYVFGRYTALRIHVEDVHVTTGIVQERDWSAVDWGGLMERVIGDDFCWSTTEWNHAESRYEALRNLSKRVARQGCTVELRYWDRSKDKSILVAPGTTFDPMVRPRS